jgi:hypothetical protein
MEEIPLITYLSCIISRLVYFNNDNFLNKYVEIFNISELSGQLKKLKNINPINIFSPKANKLIEISKKINKINYTYKNIESISTSSHVKYIVISTSNYSSVYLIADKRTNIIFIAFRGTSSIKSMLSYAKITSFLPFITCNKTNSKNGYVLGIFKIIGEMFYTIYEGINYLTSNFLKTKSFNLVTTGHSLGGGCAQIFSYLFIKKNPSRNICCVTFGSPRVMNGNLMEKYIKLIYENKIQFERIITEGDPFAKLPPTNKRTAKINTYYHIDDLKPKLKDKAIFCTNFKKTKKLQCGLKNKTNRAKIEKKNHGNYLAINYEKAAQGITNINKEIKRNKQFETICRIIIGGDEEPSKVSFFSLQRVKIPQRRTIKNITSKIYKLLITDYKHQDIYMNSSIFNKLIEDSKPLEKNNLNPLETEEYVNIEEYINKAQGSLICI